MMRRNSEFEDDPKSTSSTAAQRQRKVAERRKAAGLVQKKLYLHSKELELLNRALIDVRYTVESLSEDSVLQPSDENISEFIAYLIKRYVESDDEHKMHESNIRIRAHLSRLSNIAEKLYEELGCFDSVADKLNELRYIKPSYLTDELVSSRRSVSSDPNKSRRGQLIIDLDSYTGLWDADAVRLIFDTELRNKIAREFKDGDEVIGPKVRTRYLSDV